MQFFLEFTRLPRFRCYICRVSFEIQTARGTERYPGSVCTRHDPSRTPNFVVLCHMQGTDQITLTQPQPPCVHAKIYQILLQRLSLHSTEVKLVKRNYQIIISFPS